MELQLAENKVQSFSNYMELKETTKAKNAR
jgi:hypothetical protein